MSQEVIIAIKKMLIQDGLTRSQRKLIIIHLMQYDDYTVDDVFDVINDTVMAEDFPTLAEKIKL